MLYVVILEILPIAFFLYFFKVYFGAIHYLKGLCPQFRIG